MDCIGELGSYFHSSSVEKVLNVLIRVGEGTMETQCFIRSYYSLCMPPSPS